MSQAPAVFYVRSGLARDQTYNLEIARGSSESVLERWMPFRHNSTLHALAAFPPPSIHAFSGITDAVARATDLQAAFETLMIEVSRELKTRACIFQQMERGWTLVAQTRGGLRVSISDLHAALSSVSSDALTAAAELRAIGDGVWTLVPLRDVGGWPASLLLAGDWTPIDDMVGALVVLLSSAFRSVREREERRHAEHLLRDGYTIGRRLSRLGDLETVCQRVVEQVSRSLEADRVALALYRPEEDRLVIAATRGYAASVVRDVRIERGAWVMGHVFTAGRPVLVRDIRQIDRLALERRRYRTSSFVAVPMFAGSETVGVLSATDKKDGSAFGRRDTSALRTFSMSAALALMAARSGAEVHRLTHAATVDSLTGLFNRHYLDARLHQEVERAKRASNSLTVLMADIDDFKTINDTHGHQVGDAILQVVSGILRSAVRVFDVCARYGGDEFAIVMPSSDHSSATACAERIRQRIFDHHGLPHLPKATISLGVAVIEPGDEPADLVWRADRSLYQAKAEGKNRVHANSGMPHVRLMPLPRRNTIEPV